MSSMSFQIISQVWVALFIMVRPVENADDISAAWLFTSFH